MKLTVDSSQMTFLPTSKSCDTKTRINIKNPARTNLDIVPSLRICGQLPAPVVNRKEIGFENGRISNFEGLVTLTLDRSYCIP